MTHGTQDVSMRVNGVATKVGVAEYTIYETIDEAVNDPELGAEKLLEKLNAQVRTDEMNRVRGLVRQGPGKKALEQKALASITGEEWAQIAGNPAAIEAKLKEKMEALKAEVVATLGAPEETEEHAETPG